MSKSTVAKIKKGNNVILHGFTGMKLGVYKVTAADKETITIEKADGTELDFDRKTGKQLNPKNPKYANYITEDDGTYVNPRDLKKNKPTKAKKTKKKAKEEDIEELEDDEEEEEAPKKAKKSTKANKKAKVEEPEEDDEDEDEDFDDEDEDEDEDFEEVE